MAGMAVNDWIQLKWLAWMKMAGYDQIQMKMAETSLNNLIMYQIAANAQKRLDIY